LRIFFSRICESSTVAQASGSWDWYDAGKSFCGVRLKDEANARDFHVAGTTLADEEKTNLTIDKRCGFR
jgi:hypothetical protein